MRSRIRYVIAALAVLTAIGCQKQEFAAPAEPAVQIPDIQTLIYTKWAKPDDTLTFFADSVLVQLWGIKATYRYQLYEDTLVVERNKYTFKIDSGMLFLRTSDNVLSRFARLQYPG